MEGYQPSLRVQYGLPEADSLGCRYFELTDERLQVFRAMRELDEAAMLDPDHISVLRACLAEELEEVVTSSGYALHEGDPWATHPDTLRADQPIATDTQVEDKLARICNDAQIPPERFQEITSHIFDTAVTP